LGESNDKGKFDETKVRALLVRYNYGAQLDEYEGAQVETKSRKSRKKKEDMFVMPEETTAEQEEPAKLLPETANESVIETAEAPAPEAEKPTDKPSVPEECEQCEQQTSVPVSVDLCEDDLILLMRSIMLRAKTGMPNAVKRAEELKRILLA
jgi:hypothetical protein